MSKTGSFVRKHRIFTQYHVFSSGKLHGLFSKTAFLKEGSTEKGTKKSKQNGLSAFFLELLHKNDCFTKAFDESDQNHGSYRLNEASYIFFLELLH